VLSGFAGEVLLAALLTGQFRVSGISIGSRTDQEDMIRAIHVNRLKPVIDRSFGLEQITAAFEYHQTQSRFGKIVLEM
jgi:NADPH:quinone reductase-like Zn-dependent oxidoreductase